MRPNDFTEPTRASVRGARAGDRATTPETCPMKPDTFHAMDDGKFGVILNSRKDNVDAYNAELRRNAGRGLGRDERVWAAIGSLAAVIFFGSITWRALT